MGLQFGPDTSTSNRATIGGMIGNNSSGAHSLTYGKTLDHVIELTVLLADGSEAVLKDFRRTRWKERAEPTPSRARAYREVFRLAQQHKNEILARYPKIMRRVSGYNLDEFVKPQPFNLSRMIVGSEGTLATIVEAKMRLVPKPKWTAMDVIHFNDDIEALECAQIVLQTRALRDGVHRQDGFESRPRQHRAVAQARFRPGHAGFAPDGRVRRRNRRRGQGASLQARRSAQAREASATLRHWRSSRKK